MGRIDRPHTPRMTSIPKHRCASDDGLVHWVWENDSTLCGWKRLWLDGSWPTVKCTVTCLECWARLFQPPF